MNVELTKETVSKFEVQRDLVMARVKDVLGVHAPDLLTSLALIEIIDDIAYSERIEPNLRTVKVEDIVGKRHFMATPCVICGSENYDPYSGNEFHNTCSDRCSEVWKERKLAVDIIDMALTQESAIVPAASDPPPVEKATVSAPADHPNGSLATSPTLNTAHDPHKLIQVLRSYLADPVDTGGVHIAKFLAIPIQATAQVLKWVRYHYEQLKPMRFDERNEYLRQLLEARIAHNKAATK